MQRIWSKMRKKIRDSWALAFPLRIYNNRENFNKCLIVILIFYEQENYSWIPHVCTGSV